LAALVLFGGCASLAPDYERPLPAMPAEGQAAAVEPDVAELPWRTVYADERLRHDLMMTRHRLGAIGGLPLAQAQTALESARADLASIAAQMAQALT
jgi:outer membrane protein TolC